jgi:hypothetical protein
MANPPFNLDTADPTDASLGNAFPANERNFRDQVNSYLNTEHDINTGNHSFRLVTTAQRNALSNPPTGMLVYVTDAAPATLYINTGTPSTPAWTSLPAQGIQSSGPIGPGTGSFTSLATSANATGLAGGGGGGGGASPSSSGAGGAGGSGGWFIAWLTGLTVGNTIAYSVGGGGIGGSTGNAGGSGTQTQIASGTQTITTRTAPGGGGGGAGTTGNGSPGVGGAMATGTAGDLLGQGNPAIQQPLGVSSGTYSSFPAYGDGGVGGAPAGSGTAGTAGFLLFEWVH